jgi:hypothetical protein
MPPELLEQLGLEPCADTDPAWPEDHDALGWAGASPRLRGSPSSEALLNPCARRCDIVANVDALYRTIATRLER